MGRYGEGTHINELLGQRGTTKPEDCDYCARGAGKGFTRCPTCETPFKVDDEGYVIFDDDGKPLVDEARVGT